MRFIDIQQQYQFYKEEIDTAIHSVLEKGNFILGEEVAELEEALAKFVGVKQCLTVSSGTDSLLIALMALGIGPGDEVITTPFTFISTAEVIALLGAKPVFVDIDPETFNIDPTKIEPAITEKTRAIIPVSLFGQMADYTAINAIAEKYSLPVIEDGAQSLGATQNGNQSCGVTTVGSTSFFPAKPLGCYGDGGALFTNDTELAEKMRCIRTHGSVKKNDHPHLGINGRFDTLQAAILQVKLNHFPGEIALRKKVGDRYSEKLANHCQTPKVLPGNRHIYGVYTIRVKDRDQMAAKLKKRGVPTAVYYSKCLHQQPVFSEFNTSLPEAEKAAREVLSLPMHPWLNEEKQDQVIQAIEESLYETAAV